MILPGAICLSAKDEQPLACLSAWDLFAILHLYQCVGAACKGILSRYDYFFRIEPHFRLGFPNLSEILPVRRFQRGATHCSGTALRHSDAVLRE